MASTPKAKAGKSWAETNGTGDRNAVWFFQWHCRQIVSSAGTVFLILVCPVFAIYLWVINVQLKGSVWAFYELVRDGGLDALLEAWPAPTAEAWLYVATFGVLEAFLQLALPGSTFKGPVTPKGNTPVYKANGVQAYLTTLALFFGTWRLGLLDPAHVYDILGNIFAVLNIFSLAFCAFLVVKGILAPSSTDSGPTGSWLYDFYWGRELYPRLGRAFDLKTWTNCRMGMMGWGVLLLCYAAKQRAAEGAVSDSLLVSVGLMHVYICKFFIWETGYWGSMDIMHDRAGFYICWGCLVWVPTVYTSPAMYLVAHPNHLGTPLAAAIFAAGCLAIYINYDSDRQRQVFRATQGTSKVWGRPPRMIRAKYTTADGTVKSSLLLASGWWGLARHFHYVPEILAAFFWTLPALFEQPFPYFYVFFLTLLLTDRAYRDDERCAAKYGPYWKQYRKVVPYKMVPLLF